MISLSLETLNREELKSYIFEIQGTIKSYLNNGGNVDSFLDETDLIDDFESVLPDEEYGIFVITILNDIKFHQNKIKESKAKIVNPINKIKGKKVPLNSKISSNPEILLIVDTGMAKIPKGPEPEIKHKHHHHHDHSDPNHRH